MKPWGQGWGGGGRGHPSELTFFYDKYCRNQMKVIPIKFDSSKTIIEVEKWPEKQIKLKKM